MRYYQFNNIRDGACSVSTKRKRIETQTKQNEIEQNAKQQTILTKTMSYEKFQNNYRIPSARTKWHDYSGGDYFITFCTAAHERYFGEIVNGVIQLTEIGKYTEECVRKIETHYDDVEIPLYVIVPNHIHMIICIDGKYAEMGTENGHGHGHVETEHAPSLPRRTSSSKNTNEKMRTISRSKGRLSSVVGSIKSAVTRYANENNISFKWQTRFHDHIIRNQNESNKIAQYIENNPYNWTTDDYC